MKEETTIGNKVQGTESQRKTDELLETIATEVEQEEEDENRKIQVSLKVIQRMVEDEEFRKMFFKIAREERELKAPLVLALTEREVRKLKK